MKNLVEIVWLDATDRTMDIESFDSSSPTSLLMQRSSYGKFCKMDENAVTILTTEDKYDKEYITIPRSWIIKPKRYRSK